MRPVAWISWWRVGLVIVSVPAFAALAVAAGAGVAVVIIVAVILGIAALRAPIAVGVVEARADYEVAAPLERVFGYLDDADRIRELVGGTVVDAERLPDGRFRVGVQRTAPLGRSARSTIEQVERDPYRRIVVAETVGSRVHWWSEAVIEASGGGTRVERTAQNLYPYPLVGLLLPEFRSRAERRMTERLLETLRQGRERIRAALPP